MHDQFYKRGYNEIVGVLLRNAYEDGKIKSIEEFKEVLADVLSHCEKV